jgi:Fe-Mn family superoxide dismutase
LAKAIDVTFGSFETFKVAFVSAGVTLFGSGWVWLSRNDDGQLFITQGDNASNPLKDGLTPLLAFDVWEHAYYLDYQNRREEHLNQLWKIIDWDVVESRY